MRKKIILWLSFVVALSFILHSCIHDDVYSTSEPSNNEYQSKSLWKEDEKYIKNVIQVYRENETNIKKINGTPLWDYATTMDRFDESFLMVPVVENKKVVSVLQVPRHGKNVYFIYTNEVNDITFFQNIISARTKKALSNEANNETSKLVCTTRAVSVWLPNGGGDSNPGSGQGTWSTYHVTTCKNVQQEGCVGIVGPDGECTGGGGDSDPYPYPGGDGPQDPQEPEDPCIQAKNIFNNTAVKSRYDVLKSKVSDPNETGYGFKTVAAANLTITTQTSLLNPDATNPDKMKVGIYPTTFSYSHTHINKSNGNVSVKIFSPADINTFLIILHNAIANNTPLDTVFGGMVASDPDTIFNTYQIQYTGNGTNLPPEFTKDQLDILRNWYAKNAQEIQTETGELSHTDMQKLFNETLKKMNLNDIVLFKIEGNSNTVKKVDYNEYGSPTENNCS
ncbi:hypothetical protein A0O34_11205 [Chryseobacterium glaciei]|uniref:Uncharacterized protein n=1 Tax=Chryseobacterium glaciei TaxID=1685010 RepID=A0A172XW33_9FLAO|nr:hypothetical protein [Chryseobacterium glaciei]ANF51045.1 hypothetical protein A0O34_11205 [Chryseobacterium glaciei]